ncbi:hypothetical protein GCM10010965_15050 [Caldalkalibacillus thermarum]|uniref:DUF6710 family protein n=1 Tax=Caldalkalibacillus thermarum TaxID=296745 RepID=UPI00166DE4A4|nr:DUF6710 family protein [Caldalkalibacillus thermarum]GGK23239.1 hypothetical protein GCM10010965_15050 [Caldalkalibacillus thermarum]
MLRKILDWNRQNADLPEKQKLPYPGVEYSRALRLVESWLENETQENKVILIDFVLDVLRQDLKMDLLTTILYREEHFEDTLPNYLFPSHYYNEQGDCLEIYPAKGKERKIRIDLADDCVWVMPWRRQSLKDWVLNIFKTDFKYDKDNHMAYYFTHINVCQVYNGTHSVSAGIAHRKGSIEAIECDLSRMFDHVHTDGVAWYNAHDGSKLGDVFDFRLAIMYEVAKLKYRFGGDFDRTIGPKVTRSSSSIFPKTSKTW